MSDTGWKNPGTAFYQLLTGASGSLTFWDNAKVEDGNTAYHGLNTTGTYSHYIKVSNFGISLPESVIIKGISVRIKRNTFNANQNYDHSIRLVKGGVVAGDNKADLNTGYPGSPAFAEYGGETDLWGLSLSRADIESSTFGVVFSSEFRNSSPIGTTFIDVIQVKIHYDETPIIGTKYALPAFQV